MYTYTSPETYTNTFTRMDALMSHFELFLAYGGLDAQNRNKLLSAVQNKELSAVGIYVEEDGFRIAEVEFAVDWDLHNRIISTVGKLFDPDIPGWEHNTSPEAYLAVQRLAKFAKTYNLTVHSWIRVSPEIRNNEYAHKAVCRKLGYGGPIPPLKEGILETSYDIHELKEARVIPRHIRDDNYW